VKSVQWTPHGKLGEFLAVRRRVLSSVQVRMGPRLWHQTVSISTSAVILMREGEE
jgi:hypothetical protein